MIIRLVAILAGLAILVSLGTWQVQRLEWKRGIIERIDSRIGAEPVPLPAPETWPAMDLDDWEYRPVRLAGRFEHGSETRVYTALTEPQGDFKGPGFWVMTPLRLDAGGIVIVNRGFVPQGRATPQARGEVNLSDGPVTVSGLLRAPEVRSPFAPENDPANDAWYLRDPSEIAAAQGLDGAAPFTVDAFAAHTPPDGLPQAGETRIAIRNNHLQYALTWYALAVVLLLMSGLWLRQERTRNRRPQHGAAGDDA